MAVVSSLKNERSQQQEQRQQTQQQAAQSRQGPQNINIPQNLKGAAEKWREAEEEEESKEQSSPGPMDTMAAVAAAAAAARSKKAGSDDESAASSSGSEEEEEELQQQQRRGAGEPNARKRKLAHRKRDGKPEVDDDERADEDDDEEEEGDRRAVKRASSDPPGGETLANEKSDDAESASDATVRRPRKSSKSFLNSMPRVMDHGNGPQGHSQMRFALETNWHPSYVRTRHKNLRCFPFCAPEHKERSFCGLPITVFLRCPNAQAARKLHLMGRFRKVREKPLVEMGAKSSTASFDVSRVVFASFQEYNEAEGMAVFDFMPPRKWRYHCEQNKYTTSELHAFTAYVFDDRNICVDIKDSPHFRIVSAWRQDVNTVSRPLHPMLHRRASTSSAPAESTSAQQHFAAAQNFPNQRRSSFVGSSAEHSAMAMMSQFNSHMHQQQQQAHAAQAAMANYQQFLASSGQQQQSNPQHNVSQPFFPSSFQSNFSAQPIGGYFNSLAAGPQAAAAAVAAAAAAASSHQQQGQTPPSFQANPMLSDFLVSLSNSDKANNFAPTSLPASQRPGSAMQTTVEETSNSNNNNKTSNANKNERTIPAPVLASLQHMQVQRNANDAKSASGSPPRKTAGDLTADAAKARGESSKTTNEQQAVAFGNSNSGLQQGAAALASFSAQNMSQPSNGTEASNNNNNNSNNNNNNASFPWAQSSPQPGNAANYGILTQLQAILAQQHQNNNNNSPSFAGLQGNFSGNPTGSNAPAFNANAMAALLSQWPNMQQQQQPYNN
ncbi:Hypothetical Protein FCC1311_059142 [Hondaea fermentalgiana]|uniref:Uncharacterized protein n=1 Tax=Hondaea fermentalgiana TaxID=2315210 RepID=A0A2R5GM34_9STRA|nr:Hypothetical Protein FCC1311_059142 [Hondaea fermentalgiana]|eukprot:GBG29693.1 Hypothetical Protein FCC1311_059142 [Hondaea fermentalgiana]